MDIGHADVVALLSYVSDLAAAADAEQFATLAASGMHALVPGDCVTYNEIDLGAGVLVARAGPSGQATPRAGEELFAGWVHEHPIVCHLVRTGTPGTCAPSDLVTPRALRELGFDREYYRPRGIEGQLTMTLSCSRTRVVGLAVDRARRSFTERDRAMLELVRPALCALRIALDARTPTADLSGLGLTTRESQVVDGVARGLSNQQLAAELRISPRTVQKHLEHIYDKLGERSRTAMLARARGLVAR